MLHASVQTAWYVSSPVREWVFDSTGHVVPHSALPEMNTLRPSYWMLAGLLLIVYGAYVGYPLAMTVVNSLRDGDSLSLTHYLSLFDPRHPGNWEAVWNSVFVSALSVVFSAVVGVLLALVFTQISFPLSGFLARLAVLPIALPPLVGVISFLFVFGESGFVPRLLQMVFMADSVPFYLDGFWAVVVVHVFSFNVYFYLFVSTALRNLDSSMLEAAGSLGSSPLRTFVRVVLPALKPALLGASVLTFMASMASFSAPFIFGGARRFLTTQIYSTKLNGELDLAAAQSILLAVVSIGFFLVLQLSSGSRAGGRASKGASRTVPMSFGPFAKRLLIGIAGTILVFEILPILTILVISFVKEGSWTWQILPSVFTTENFEKLIRDPRVLEPIRNSVTMTALALAGAVAVGTLAAYAITKGVLRKRRTAFDILFTMPFAIPGTVVAISLILAFNEPRWFTGGAVLAGSFWILPLAYFIRTYPLVIRSTSAALEQLDDSLLDAAQTFGAGPLRRFRSIVLPIILPGIAAGGLLTAIAGLGEFVSSILLYTYSSRPISIEILSQLRGYNFGAAAAYCVVLLVLILVLTVLSQRLGRKGGVKGDIFNF